MEMWSAKLTSSANCSDFLPNPDSRLTDLYWPESSPPRTSQRNPENDELIRQDLNLIFEVVKSKLAAFFIKEKAKDRLSKDANEDRLADFCIATVQGAMLLGRIKRDERPVDAIVEVALAHVKCYAAVGKG